MGRLNEVNIDTLDTSVKGDIGQFAQILNDSQMTTANLQRIAGQYDFALMSMATADKVSTLHTANPNIKVLLFLWPYGEGFGDEFWASQASYDQAILDYRMLDADSNQAYYGGPTYGGIKIPQTARLMDVSKTSYIDYYAFQANKHADLSGYDGIFIDTHAEEAPFWAYDSQSRPPLNYNATTWRNQAIYFAEELNTAVSPGLLYFNGVTRANGITAAQNPTVALSYDHAAIEAFSVNSGMDASADTKKWYHDQTCAVDLAGGVGDLIEVYLDVDSKEHRLYALACYLLYRTANSQYYITDHPTAGGEVYRPEYSLVLGDPVGTAYKAPSGAAWIREYELGFVAANPTPEATENPLGNTMLPSIVNTVLQPFSGWIGLK